MNIRLWPKRRSLRLLFVVVAIVFVPYLYSRAISPWRRVTLRSATAPQDSDWPTANASTFRVVTYNIAHGRGLALSNWEGGSRAVRASRLDEIADLLHEIDADVVVLNEVDFDCSWSHGVNQAEYLARKAGYPFWAEQSNLDFRILFARWRFGNAVLSRIPIANAEQVSLPGYSWWETISAGKKRGLLCSLDSDGTSIEILATHLSHRSETVRAASAEAIADLVKQSASLMIVAGDLNSAPPGFPDATRGRQGKNAVEVLEATGVFNRMPESPPDSNGMTFHADAPRAVIDWILIPSDSRFARYKVVASKLSDHRPVYADVQFVAPTDAE